MAIHQDNWAEIGRLVELAMALPPAERSEFLRKETSDEIIRAEVEELLTFESEASLIFPIKAWQRRQGDPAESDLTGKMIGNYRLLDELGRGGMGAVYLAERADGVYRQKVALKVLQESVFTVALAERFRQERQILAGLSHPGIARLLDGGVTPDGRPYLVLEFVDGKPIDRYCEEAAVNTTERLELFLRVAEVVQSAHQQLVLHLDLKPANILVTAEGEPRLLDFGISRFLMEGGTGSARTEATLRLLTPRYASPEQAEGATLGVASDVFSLATLLYRLLTGKLPYPIENASPLEAARIILETAPMLPSAAAPAAIAGALKGDVDTILLQALRKEPERRYPTIAAFAEDVRRHLVSEPVLAHADNFRYRAGKFLHRNRVPMLALGVVSIVLAGSIAAVVRSAIVARRDRATAVRRLADVRALAHSYIFDLDPKLEDIPGTIGVRHFVLQNAQKYLAAMSQESVDDDELAHETAQGYSQIAHVQQGFAQPSLSDSLGAQASISKGVAIQTRLVQKYPKNPKERILLVRQMQHLATVYAYNGDLVQADQIIHQAWEVGQPLLVETQNEKRLTDLAPIPWDMAWMRCGNGDLWNFADPVVAMTWLDRSTEITRLHLLRHPDQAKDSFLVGVRARNDISRAAILTQLGRGAEVRPLYEEALQLTTLNHSMVEDEMRRQVRGYYAAYLLSVHEVKAADAVAALLPQSSFHEKGGDRLLSSDEADELTLLARVDLESGRIAAGKRRLQVGLDSLEALHKSIPEDADVSSELAWNSFRLAEEKALDEPTRKRLYLRAIEVAEEYASTHPQVVSAALLEGKCQLGLAEMAGSGHHLQEQQSLATKSVGQFQKVLAAHPVQPEASSLLVRAKALGSN